MQPWLPSPIILVPSLAIWLALLSIPVFRGFADDAPRKYAAIDGLRGLLAILVFAAHFVVTLQWQRTGGWQFTTDHIWGVCAHAAVTLFFMITGLLFFEKIGTPSKRLDYASFLRARILRIYPVYVVTLVAVALIAAALSERPAPIATTLGDLGAWLLFIPQQLFGMAEAGMIVAYVPWSLRYEWLFYFSLPVLAWSWRAARFNAAFLVALAVLTLLLTRYTIGFAWGDFAFDTRYLAPFALGGLTLLPLRHARVQHILRGPVGSLISVAAVASVCVRGEPYTMKPYLALWIAFVPIACGASLFGLLRLRAMQILGAASYDIYILHGVVLFVCLHVVAPGIAPDLATIGSFVLLTVIGCGVIALAILVHRLVEVPAMRSSRRLRGTDPRERLAAP